MVLEVKFGQRPVLGLVFSEVNENLVVEANKAYVNLLKERKELFFQKKKGMAVCFMCYVTFYWVRYSKTLVRS